MILFIYDNTFEGLLTAIYDGFYSKEPPSYIYGINDSNAPLMLGDIKEIITEKDKFSKVKNAIIQKINLLALKKIYTAFLSNEKDKEMLIFKYLKVAFKIGPKVHNFLNIYEIRLIDELNKRVTHEAHRFTGFIRFNCVDEKFLYSSIEPDNDILELLGDHFKNRFSREYFIINDISREKALIYNKFSYEIIDMDKETYEQLKSHEDQYSSLWKTYFKSTTIEERRNPKLQARLMPKRYWKHILETSS
ncbi:TIGR03915 family putative DNA repair protein [Clostridium sp. C2-6-12]|uniref:TIGR03915 family putative DNA repair protein n=1 Tax=Clostridium sp. C2-6-12 TaxID=2698832 RepID=UPI00136F1763|nr:TIGR03915 family putative DNA repair protein [Clostridium sp. C2-6-12]